MTEPPRKSSAPRGPAKASFVRKHASAIVLSTIALAGIVYVALVDKKTLSTSEQESRKKNVFPAWRKDDLSKVVIKNAAGTATLTRNKAAGDAVTWSVSIDGKDFPGDDQNIDKLLQTLEYATFTRSIPAGSVDRAGFGFDDPRSTVDVTMGEVSFHLAVGRPAPTPGEAYAEIKGGGVFALSAALVSAIELDPDELRSKTFVPYPPADIVEIDLSGEGGERSFVRGNWIGGRGSGFRMKSDRGDGVRVAGPALDRVLGAFAKMQANAFVDDATADKAATNRVTVTLVPKDGPRGVLSIGGPCPTKKDQVIAIRREPTRLNVCVPGDVMAPLSQPVADFEDHGLIGAASDEVTEVRILEHQDGADRKLEIARSGSGFKMRAPADRTISNERGGAFLRGLLEAKGEILPADTHVPEGTAVEVRVLSQGGMGPTGKTGERTEELAIYRQKEDAIVVRKEDGRMLRVPSSTAHAFAVSDLLVRDPQVLSIKAADVTSLAIDGAGKKQRLERKGSLFELIEPKGKGLTADQGLTLALVERLAALKTTRFIADADDGSFGLSAPRMTIEIGTGTKSEADAGTLGPVKLFVGARTDDGSYGKLSNDPAVFLLPVDIEEQAAVWLVNRADFPITTATVDKITLRPTEGKELVLARDGSALHVVGANDKRALDIAADVQQAFEDFLPLAAVTVGKEADYQGFAKPALSVECSGPKSKVTYRIGAGDTYQGTSVFYVRRDDVDATFVVPQSAVRPLVHAVSKEP